MSNNAPLDRMRKILALARRGVDGEKATAESMLSRLMAKYGITVDELEGAEAKREMRSFTYSGALEKRLLRQCIARVLNVASFDSWRPKNEGRHTVYQVELTSVEYAEVSLSFDVWRVALEKHIDLAFSAFIQANKITPDIRAGTADPMSSEDAYYLAQMMAGTARTSIVKRIGGDQ